MKLPTAWRPLPLLMFLLALPTAPSLKAQPTMTAPAASAAQAADLPDPYRWLEDVQGDRALAWVRERNAVAERELEAVPGHEARRQAILDVFDSRHRIPAVRRLGPHLYNLWTDAEHPRGLWRRTTLAEYRKPQPRWETLLDIGALGRAEGENWVWSGAQCLGPEYRRCLLSLSRGGADARVVREFDLVERRFVDGGFSVAEAKTNVAWIDADTVFVASDFGAGSLTDSGYPRLVKRWRRGQPLADASMVFEAETGDVGATFWVDRTPGFERIGFARELDFYRSRSFLLRDGRLLPIDKPADAALSFWRDRVLIQLRSDWTAGGRTWPRGSLLVADAAAYLDGRRELTALFTPTATRSLSDHATTRSRVIVNVLEDVTSRLEEWRATRRGWQRREIPAPRLGSLSVAALHDPLVGDDALAEDFWLSSSSFLQPDTLQLGRTGSARLQTVKSLPEFFDAGGMRVEQRFARSADGTRVPYFVVWPATPAPDGGYPTLLYGYGGFEVSLTPWYLGSTGRTWLGQGGVFVVANIRGGGEYGPEWHQAAVKAGKQRSYDDFAAVAEALIATGVTSPQRLGIQGGSNGGLLVGAVALQRPELFAAVVCQVPLLDMRRYHRLLAGASWMAEFGDPDNADEWAWIGAYSPYHNVRPGAKLPAMLLVTSTRDDRVHPGHARKMAARLLEQGHAALYWENIEGGHGGAADNAQRARMRALEMSFLWRQLGRR